MSARDGVGLGTMNLEFQLFMSTVPVAKYFSYNSKSPEHKEMKDKKLIKFGQIRECREFSFSGILVRITFICSCSTLRVHFLFLVTVEKYEIDKKIFFLTLKHEIERIILSFLSQKMRFSFSFFTFFLHSIFSKKFPLTPN